MTRMKPTRKVANFGVPSESGYGYVQAIQVKDTIYLSGQLSHDSDGTFVAPADLDGAGRPVNYSQMEGQFRQTYVNAKGMLAKFGATLDDVVEEDVFVLDVPAAFSAAAKVRKEMYGTDIPQCASSIFGVSALARPEQLVEITFRAVIENPSSDHVGWSFVASSGRVAGDAGADHRGKEGPGSRSLKASMNA